MIKILIIVTLIRISISYPIFAQISDIHYDPNYLAGTPNNCVLDSTGLTCCTNTSIPLEPYQPAGKYGEFNCDTPFALVNITLDYLSQFQLDFILWTGDTPDHHILSQSFEKNFGSIDVISQLFMKYFPETVILPCLGNHDTFPVDQMAQIDIYQNYLKSVATLWSKWVDVETFSIGGYYVKQMNDKLKIIVMNSLYYDPNNVINRMLKGSDAGQLAWIESILQNTPANQSVWIIGHIPPGSGEANATFVEAFKSFSARYPVLKESFWGHSHHDEFFLFNDSDSLNSHGYIVPSVTPDGLVNPSVRLYEYNIDYVTNYHQFYIDLEEANKGDAVFKYSYSPIPDYGIETMNATSWRSFYNNLITNQTLLNIYNYHYFGDYQYVNCIDQCRADRLGDILV
jgi:sphingomyelin phosphodiesterase